MLIDSDASRVLMREGYYSIINGYKDPFIDIERSQDAGDDRYIEGVQFSDLYGLFLFDRSLRLLTFRYLIIAEATARTAVAHTFAKAHADPDDYLLQSSYCTKEEFRDYGKDEDDYTSELNKLISILSWRRDRSNTEFVAHYRDEYGRVPIWVLCNDLTFGNIEHFFILMKPSEKEATCKMIAGGTGRLGDRLVGYFDVRIARISLEVLVKFRNICAHDERLYCAHVGDRKYINFAKMIWMLERYLTNEEFFAFLEQVNSLIGEYKSGNGSLAHVLSQLGYPELMREIQSRIEMLDVIGTRQMDGAV